MVLESAMTVPEKGLVPEKGGKATILARG